MPAAESTVKYTNTSANTRAQTPDRCIIFAGRCVHRFNSDNVAGSGREIMEGFFEIKREAKNPWSPMLFFLLSFGEFVTYDANNKGERI